MVISMEMDDIPPYGYVTVTAGTKYTACDAPRHTALTEVVKGEDDVGSNMIAAWTILQDVGSGFFATEIPTSTVTMAPDTNDDDVIEFGCYGDGSEGNTGVYSSGAPDYRCGLIPERHNNASTTVDGVTTLTPATATTSSHVTARFDVIEGSENDVFVWLAEGEDMEDTAGSDVRRVDVTVTCEDGMTAQIPDESAFADAGAMVSMATVRLPNRINVLDPMGYTLMPFASQCMDAGGRGTLQFRMPAGSYAGMVWTHISQRGKNFRMNQPGYNMASPTMNCGDADEDDTVVDCL
jgi:hypothetical protein